jgi:hypothetical protein
MVWFWGVAKESDTKVEALAKLMEVSGVRRITPEMTTVFGKLEVIALVRQRGHPGPLQGASAKSCRTMRSSSMRRTKRTWVGRPGWA